MALTVSDANADELTGDWSLDLDSGTPAWMSVQNDNGIAEVKMRLHVGPDGPHKDIQMSNDRITFTLRQGKKATDTKTVDAEVSGGKLEGLIRSTSNDGTIKIDRFSGTKIPPVSASPPDLSKVRFGHPIRIFNGTDLTGW